MYKKLFSLTLFLFFTFAMFAQQQVKIFVSYTNSYCGGARPTDEIINKYKASNKLSNFKIKLLNKKPITFTTDSLGRIITKLRPGKYHIFLTEENNKKLFTNYDPTCVKMLKPPYGELLIEPGKNNYKINLHFPCNPCQPHDKP